jgi:hypothetical protein
MNENSKIGNPDKSGVLRPLQPPLLSVEFRHIDRSPISSKDAEWLTASFCTSMNVEFGMLVSRQTQQDENFDS